MKVPVDLDVNPKTKNFTIQVYSPPTAELIKKEIGIESGSGTAKKTKVGNLAIEQIIKIAQVKQPNMTASSFKAAVRSVIGSCVSIGILVENKEAKEIEREVAEGKYDKEIQAEITQLSDEKKKQLNEFFTSVKNKQEEALRKEEELKKAEEAEKAAKAPAAAPAATAAAPGAAAPAATAAAPGAAAKPTEKPAAKKK
jgi:large subunit ribosomal protein L11